MTKARRVFAILMGAILALPLLCTTVLADEVPYEAYSFVVKKDLSTQPAWQEQYDYKLYQMFTGDVEDLDGKTVLANVQWGASVPAATREFMYQFCGLTGSSKTAQNVADQLAETGDAVFHQILERIGKSDGSSLTVYKTLQYGTYNGENGFGAMGVPEGYYLVRNDAIPAAAGESYSDYIVRIVDGDTAVEPKAAPVPSTTKQVTDKNDTQPTNDNFNAKSTSADHDIGDTISYELTATLPSNFSMYDTYKLVFKDDMAKGLTYNNDAKIYFGRSDTTGVEIEFDSTDYAEDDARFTGGKHLEYAIANLKNDAYKSYNLGDNTLITIRYTATLNSDAVIGIDGNVNEYTVEFSNNPTVANSTSTTPPNTAIVFTYKLVFNKVDENGNALTGADFVLEKLVAGEETSTWVDVTSLHTGTGAINPTKTKGSKQVEKDGATTTVNDCVFTFAGLDDGTYRIRETVTPAGYNTVKDMHFTVYAGHTIAADGTNTLNLSATPTDDSPATIDLASHYESDKLTGLAADIVNPAGSMLPTTGGTGTTMLYVVGGALVAFAVVSRVAKRRVDAAA